MPSAIERAAFALGSFRDHVIGSQQLHLVRGERRLGQELQKARLHAREPERQGDEQTAAPGRSQHVLHQLAKAEHFRSAQFVGGPRLCFAQRRLGDRGGDVAGENRLELGVATADQRKRRHKARQRGKFVEEIVVGAKQDRRSKDRRCRGHRENAPLALGFAARVVRGRMLVGADRRHVDQLRALACSRSRHRLGADCLHDFEALAAPLKQDPDEIDDDACAAHRGRDGCRVAQVGLHRMNLADPAQGLQMAREIWAAHGHADAKILLGQRADDVAAEKTRATEYGHQGVDLVLDVHWGRPSVRCGAEYRIVGRVYSELRRRGRVDNRKPHRLCVIRKPRWRNW